MRIYFVYDETLTEQGEWGFMGSFNSIEEAEEFCAQMHAETGHTYEWR